AGGKMLMVKTVESAVSLLSRAVLGTAVAVVLAAGCGKVEQAKVVDSIDAAQTIVDAAGPAVDGAMTPDAALTWSPLQPVSVDFSESVLLPVLSGDGRTLYFNARNSATNDFVDVYFATRDSLDTGFAGSAPVPVVNVAGVQQRYPEISRDGLELYVVDATQNILVATRASTGVNFDTPTAVVPAIKGTF